MSSSGYILFFVTLRPGFEPRENIRILTRGQGIQGASCTSIPNSKTTYSQTTTYAYFFWLYNGSNGKHMFDETYVLMIFSTYISSSFGSNRNICFWLRKTFDPRRWGFRHLYLLHSELSRLEGSKLVYVILKKLVPGTNM